MPEVISAEERDALIAQFEELKRHQRDPEPDIEFLLDAEARFRFGTVIYRAIAASKRA